MANECNESRGFGPLQSAIAQWLQKSYDLSAPIPAEHARLLRQLDQPEHLDTAEPKFKMLTAERP
jgi:hypothetical protein